MRDFIWLTPENDPSRPWIYLRDTRVPHSHHFKSEAERQAHIQRLTDLQTEWRQERKKAEIALWEKKSVLERFYRTWIRPDPKRPSQQDYEWALGKRKLNPFFK